MKSFIECTSVCVTLVVIYMSVSLSSACPEGCYCNGKVVSCRAAGLYVVPFGISNRTERIHLQHNNISRVLRNDFAGQTELRKLHLNDNKIQCIQEGSFQSLINLEILLLNNNNLSAVPSTIFGDQLVNLRMINLQSNPLHCNCQLVWLTEWMVLQPTLTVSAVCIIPQNMQLLPMTETSQLPCPDTSMQLTLNTCEAVSCPENCICGAGVVDCRNRQLEVLPALFPQNVTELRLEQNFIRIIPTMAFWHHKELRRIDLSNNIIDEIQADAFRGLHQLTSLVLYGNELTTLPPNVFQDLTQLQMLLLNANKIKCLRHDAFNGLVALNLLSLYDNRIQHLVKGTFKSLQAIETLHLAQNPFICDCKLRWLTKYLKKNPVETSGAKCAGPLKLANKKIALIRGRRFKCNSAKSQKSFENVDCLPEVDCPRHCQCDATTIDCSGQGMQEIPDNLPPYGSTINLSGNSFSLVANRGFFKKLQNVKMIDLSNNQIVRIEDGAFAGAENVVELHLNNNMITEIQGSSFDGLLALRTLILRNNRLSCVGNNSFHGLSMLQHLSLYGNQITTIMDGSFNSLSSLQTLNLLSNPLNCNCHMNWFSTWLRNSVVATGNLRCTVPSFLAGLPIADINSQDFQCSNEELEMLPCMSARVCPTGCDCQGSVVWCGNAGLTSFPVTDILHDVTELYMEINAIQLIPSTINQFVFITTLDMSNNQLTSINSNQFSNLSRLTTLLLAYNNIRCISGTSFAGLMSLKTLSLHSNDLSSLPEGVFHGLTALTHVGFGANPWYCDCHLRWFAQFFDEMGIARCSGPENMEGRLITSTPSSLFVCQGALDISIASKCNPCLSTPCQHNSSCVENISKEYLCHCRPGFEGRNCELLANQCTSSPCLNGGTCKLLDTMKYVCNCLDGFKGDQCQINIDECEDRPCIAQNATCIDQVNSFLCKCPLGWHGKLCNQLLLNTCESINPCENGAECISMQDLDSTTYRCVCPSGFMGQNCSEKVYPCLNHNCQNGGVCVADNQSAAGYHCNCNEMYRGLNCSIPVVDVFVQDDPCSNNYCLNGGECYHKPESNEYGCWCPPGYSGNTCEKLRSINFKINGSYVPLHSMQVRNMNFTIFLSTVELFGIIFYKGNLQNTKHIAVEFYSGHVRLSIDLGNFPGSTLYSTIPVNDGKIHKIQVLIHSTVVSMRIDNDHSVRVNVGSGSSENSEPRTPLYIGGIESQILSSAKRMIHIRNSTSFKGCISALYINGSEINFHDFITNQHQVAPGCTAHIADSTCSLSRCGNHGRCEYRQGYGIQCACYKGYSGLNCNKRHVPVCEGHLCKHGSCTAEEETYKCQCFKGFSGKYCQNQVCADVQCNHGTCIPATHGYKCKCNRHYTGEHCQDRIRKCRGARIKQFFEIRQSITHSSDVEETKNLTRVCRSKRRYTNVLCNSACATNAPNNKKVMFARTSGHLCCQPLRIQPKRVRMKCEDGSHIYEIVQKVRRCACKPCITNA
uniref:Slit homolog 2 protein n=1 Tax=Phallusia mammillata TaxID=59560 RepID=A0A6F9DU14_9ASCI|nr:slit homolog 2 protein [Phallusia mammillata]